MRLGLIVGGERGVDHHPEAAIGARDKKGVLAAARRREFPPHDISSESARNLFNVSGLKGRCVGAPERHDSLADPPSGVLHLPRLTEILSE